MNIHPAGPSAREPLTPPSFLSARDLCVDYRTSKGKFRALCNVNLNIARGQTLGVVGESGSGKSTLGRALLRLIRPSSGQIFVEGEDIAQFSHHQLRGIRQKMQMVFQDPYSSLNPRLTVREIVEEALIIHRLVPRADRDRRVRELLQLVGLSSHVANRYPHEFSGGQRQRVGIARALSVNPAFLLLDEPISALDVSVQAQIMNMLQDLKESLQLTYLFIAHNLEMIRYISDHIAVMYLGHVVESAPGEELYRQPKNHYTQLLLAAAPLADPDRERQRLLIQSQNRLDSSQSAGASIARFHHCSACAD